ncbi:glycosyltransferase family 2 protein [Clostridium sp. JN-9]|uniref:glycosyltransferase family 2 protein n=1 Tax=Clostridium sp. JN-9 TaxID=2507159 RepID=UPI000FFE096D|nr:glycosyltransferase family 2 protein [Clostridium sp. JN-9]QAT41046.1 glycosyltransferase family 2 protein [Clostridium sp. JN-9]
MCDLSIIIVSWNTKDLVRDCLNSIKKCTHSISYKVFLVDNNSSDGTVQMVKHEFKDVTLIANKTNNGFAKANNQAIKISDSRYIILLNPDTIVHENALDNMVHYLQQHEDVGIVGCKLLNPDGSLQESCRRFPDLSTYSTILLKLHTVFPNKRCLRRYFMKEMNYNTINEVDQVMGAALMYRTNVLGEKSYLDEDYWIWFEEVDFCYNVKKKGYKVVYIPDAEIIHYKAQSFNQLLKVQQQKVFNKSLLRYFQKNGKKSDTIILKLLFPVSILLSYVIQLGKAIKKRG